jgi:hypothetical protein
VIRLLNGFSGDVFGDQGFGLIEAVGCMEQRGEVVAVSGDVGVVRSEAVLDEGGPDVCRARS